MSAIDGVALDQIFRAARTHYAWQPTPVGDDTLRTLFDTLKMGPTSANASPARFVFVRTPEGKDRLMPALSEANKPKVQAAPVTAIVAYDPRFYDHLPKLFPHADAKSWFSGNAALAETTAFRNGSLQGAYLIIAARALGLDTGPMSGFDNHKVDDAFFAANGWKSNFLVSIGYGDTTNQFPRAPRFEFDEACQLA